MNKTKLFCSIGCMFVLNAVTGQQKKDSIAEQQLDEVVITDSRFELKRENSGKTVVKIDRNEIERNQGRTVAELINSKSGIEINGSRSVAGQNLGYFIRGGNNRQVLVLIDGVQVNDPSLVSNDFDLRLIDLNTIESIEIVKGAASTLYGNAAATAVINITTKKASDSDIKASLLSILGTNQTQNDQNYNVSSFTNHISVNGTLDQLSYVFGFGNNYEDGLSAAKSENPEPDVFSRYNSNLKLNYRLSEKFNVSGFVRHDKFKTDIDGFPPPNFVIADTDDTSISEQLRYGISSKLKYKNGSISINTAITEVKRETISAFSAENEARSVIVDAFNKYTINENIYTILGLNYGEFSTKFTEQQKFTTTDPYVNLVYISDFGLTLNTGGRLNNHSEYGNHFVYSVNPSYKVNLNNGYLKAFGSYATSFIAPNLSQLFGLFGANPNLEPEENITTEIGLEYNLKKGLRISGVLFNRNEDNTIIFNSQSLYENASEDATVRGFEAEAEINFIKKLRFSANYAFTELETGERLRLPKHKANASVAYSLSNRTDLSFNYQYVGERLDLDFATFTNRELEAYSILDFYISHNFLNDKLKLFARVDNIFNEDYTEIIGYSTLGRNISLGFNLNL